MVTFLCLCLDQLFPQKRSFKFNLLEIKGWIVLFFSLDLAWTWMLWFSLLVVRCLLDKEIRKCIWGYTAGFFVHFKSWDGIKGQWGFFVMLLFFPYSILFWFSKNTWQTIWKTPLQVKVLQLKSHLSKNT